MRLRFLSIVMAGLLAAPALAQSPNGNSGPDGLARTPAQIQPTAPSGAAPAPEAEPVIIMPAAWITGVLEYLASRPWKEVNGALTEARGCLALQSQHATGGAIVSHGECKAVMSAIQAQMHTGATP